MRSKSRQLDLKPSPGLCPSAEAISREASKDESGADSPVSSPEASQRLLLVPVLRPPVLERAQRTYGNRASRAMLARALRRSPVNLQANRSMVPGEAGQRIDDETRRPFESHFGADFSDVRVHTSAEATDSAERLDAVAFTTDRDIYFSSGAYAPSGLEGSRLLAHELTHVAQQKRDTSQSARFIQRKPVPQQKMPDWQEPETFTPLKTRQLDASGPYTEYLLYFISTSWTKGSGRTWIAQQVVDALESSPYFVGVARELDGFYRKRPHPRFAFSVSLTGTKYVPAGSPVQFAKNEPVWIDRDANTIELDYSRSGIEGSDEKQIAGFVSAIIHESTHAFDHIKKITETGLSGDLEEEQRTRKGEIKGLQQVKAGTTNTDLASELDNRIASIKRAGLSRREIAEDLVSAGDFTYLESFYVGTAVGQFLAGETNARAQLDPSTSEIANDIKEIAAYDDLNYPLLLATAEYSVVMNSSLDTEKPLSRKYPISAAHKALLLHLLKTPMTLKELTEARMPSMTAEERLLFFHILLVRTYHLKNQIQDAWAAFSAAPGNMTVSQIAEKNARNFLGRPKEYSQIKD